MFEIGQVYNRQGDIHAKYGGQQQGGISTPVDCPFIFLFTGEEGEAFGYSDGWHEGDIYLYTGEGQTADMEFVRGNRAIRDYGVDGKELLLFASLGKGPGGQYSSTWYAPTRKP